ncbi:MAG: Ig-like domain-containing protein [Candidatus Aenigmatarchaeota archaeon]
MITTPFVSQIVLGDNIYDTATITGISGIPITGSVTFYVCTAVTCPSGGTFIGSTDVPLNTGETVNVQSPSYTPTTSGTFSFRADYSGDANYLTTIESNLAQEVFTVVLPVTRTQGFWQTHTSFTKYVYENYFGTNNQLFIGQNVDVAFDTHKGIIKNYPSATGINEIFGAYYASIPKTTTGAKRIPTDQARMTLLQQLLTAKLNCAAFGCPSSILSKITAADNAYRTGNVADMKMYTSELDAYNNLGDGQSIPAPLANQQGKATPKSSQSAADAVFWNKP